MTLMERILWFPPILSNGKMKWDKKRGKLQKIFKTENFVMVTFGTNEFDAGKHNRIRVYLEDWVNANISKYKTPSACGAFLHHLPLPGGRFRDLREVLHERS